MIFPIKKCPPPWEITRAASEGSSIELQNHLSECPSCRASFEEETRLATLAPALAIKDFSIERRQSTKQKFLQTAAERPRANSYPITRWLSLAAGILLVAGGLYWWLPEEKMPAQESTKSTQVSAESGAVFTQEYTPNLEKITLQNGKISLHKNSGEKTVVLVEGSKVVLLASRAEIFATNGELQSVYVWEGSVEIHYLNEPAIVISAGEHWTKPAPQSAPSTVPTSVAASLPEKVTSKPVQKNLAEEAFADGFSLMRDKKFEEAALAFGRAAKSKGSLQEDALFWQAMALGRANKASEARASLESFLLRYPSSPRAGEAAIALGWLLFDAKDLEGARRWFKVAQRDPSTTVSQRAQEALSQLPPETP